MKKLLLAANILLFSLTLIYPKVAFAQSLQKCGNGILTGVGCIPVDSTQSFVGWMLGWAIGISGGIAFLFIVFSGVQIMTAQGDPQKLNNGRELLTAAVSGLILIIFSVFLLRVIGVNILQLPGF